jgi:hypothetical protein
VKTRPFVVALCLLFSLPAAGQLTSEFYLEKTTFAPGEPVFLYHKITNHQTPPQTITPDDPQQPECSGVRVTVSADKSCSFWSCSIDGGPSPTITLAAGQSTTGRYLLNYDHEINAPGDYWAEARFIDSRSPEDDVPVRLSFHVDGNLPHWSTAQYQPWLDQLSSTVFEQRLEGARTLASLAPQSLETVLLGFKDRRSEISGYAPLALYRLNTPRSMDALADLLKSYDSFTREFAAHYLAESGDQKWYPLLLDAAQKHLGDTLNGGVYLVAAAQLGGEKMLPVLGTWLKDKDHRSIQGDIILGIEATHSRNAIPLLLDLVDTSNHRTSDFAQHNLERLTHRSAFESRRFRNRKAESRKWHQWWASEGATAPIYEDLCFGEKPVPLPGAPS